MHSYKLSVVGATAHNIKHKVYLCIYIFGLGDFKERFHCTHVQHSHTHTYLLADIYAVHAHTKVQKGQQISMPNLMKDSYIEVYQLSYKQL